MDESGLRPYLDLVIVSGDVGVHKPDPALFLYACDKVQLPPVDCMYVGDHPVNDIAGALSAGMQAVRMNWGWFKDQDLRAGCAGDREGQRCAAICVMPIASAICRNKRKNAARCASFA